MDIKDLQPISREDLLSVTDGEVVKEVKSSDLSINNNQIVTKEGRTLTQDAEALLGKTCGYNSKFFKTTTQNVRKAIFQDYVKDQNHELQLVEKGSVIEKVMSKDAVYIPLNQICEVIVGVEKESAYQFIKMDDSTYTISNITIQKKAVAKDDILQAGIMFKVKYGNGTDISFGPYIYRLVCTNGMLSPDYNLQSLECSSSEDFKKQLDFHYSKYLNSATRGMDIFGGLLNKKVEDVGQYVHGWARSNKVSGNFEKQILDLTPTLENPTEYNILNLITSYANTRKAKDWYSLISQAGSRVFEPKEICKCCRRDLLS